jgi:hypothetical protein
MRNRFRVGADRPRPIIRFAPGLKKKMLDSVGKLDPEHYAVLVGDLNDPFYVTDLRPMPPMIGDNGRLRHSGAAVTLNAPFIEYYLNTEVLPAGKYFLGFMHSHPGGMATLSGGLPGSGQGDIPSMRSHLEKAQRAGVAWHYYLAPIVTYPGDNPQVTGWVIHLDAPDPISAEIVWESEAGATAPRANLALTLPSAFAAMSTKLQACTQVITAAATDPAVDERDRWLHAEALRATLRIYVKQQLRKQMKGAATPDEQDGPVLLLPPPGRKPRTRLQ